eukprot:scaffold109233_cov60-Phaeocystis_antarctica.AAC.5
MLCPQANERDRVAQRAGLEHLADRAPAPLQPHDFSLEALELSLARERGVAGVTRDPRKERAEDADTLLGELLHLLQYLLHALLLPRAELAVSLLVVHSGLLLGQWLSAGA